MERPKYIRLEGVETKKNFLNHPSVIEELNKQRNNKAINEDEFILAVITHLFDDTDLPIELDFIFQDKNIENSEQMKMVIRGCFNYGTKFHTKLWRGYNHLAIMEFEKPNSYIVKSLKPYSDKKRWDVNLIMCKSEESESCKELITFVLENSEKNMKENSPKQWAINKKEEQEYKKRKNP